MEGKEVVTFQGKKYLITHHDDGVYVKARKWWHYVADSATRAEVLALRTDG